MSGLRLSLRYPANSHVDDVVWTLTDADRETGLIVGEWLERLELRLEQGEGHEVGVAAGQPGPDQAGTTLKMHEDGVRRLAEDRGAVHPTER